MKRLFNCFIAITIVLSALLCTVNAQDPAQNDIIVMEINSKNISRFGESIVNDVAPIIVNDRTMLPARFVAEALGAEVKWEAKEQKVTIVKNDTTISLYIGKDTAYVNDIPLKLDAPVFILNDRTYTPVRLIAEKLGASVEWNAEKRQVIINKNGYVTDAQKYDRDVEYFYGSLSQGTCHNSVIIPKLNGDSDAVKELNRKIAKNHSDAIEILKSEEKIDTIYNISYDYFVYNDTVGILVCDGRARYGSFWNTAYYGYYFDLKAQKELSFTEYMDKLNINYSEMVDKLNQENTISDFGQTFTISNDISKKNITAAIFGDTQTLAAYVGYGWGMEKLTCSPMV